MAIPRLSRPPAAKIQSGYLRHFLMTTSQAKKTKAADHERFNFHAGAESSLCSPRYSSGGAQVVAADGLITLESAYGPKDTMNRLEPGYAGGKCGATNGRMTRREW